MWTALSHTHTEIVSIHKQNGNLLTMPIFINIDWLHLTCNAHFHDTVHTHEINRLRILFDVREDVVWSMVIGFANSKQQQRRRRHVRTIKPIVDWQFLLKTLMISSNLISRQTLKHINIIPWAWSLHQTMRSYEKQWSCIWCALQGN